MRVFSFTWSVLAVAALVMAGCGGPARLRTKGRVVKSGAAFVPAPGQFVRVTFVPVPAGNPPQDHYVAEVNNTDGTFRVAGKDGKGMPPGKYRVAIELDQHRSDMLKGQFDAERSPFVFDVDSSTKEMVLDLDNPPKQ